MSAPDFLYEVVADDLAALIEAGTLRPGDRVPSVRALSRERGVSVSTVLQAYRSLEDRGYVEARPQSGFYVRARAAHDVPTPSPTSPRIDVVDAPCCDLPVEVMGADGAGRARDHTVASLGPGVPAPDLLPTSALGRELARAVRYDSPDLLSYTHAQGDPDFRAAVARRSAYWGGTLAPDDIVVTAGCMEALSLSLLAVTEPGDAVAVESPVFFGTLQLLRVLGRRVVEVATDPATGVCLDALEETLDRVPVAACLFSPTYHNPLGGTVPDGDKAALVALLAEREIPLIEDDVYGDLHHGPQRPRPCKAFDVDGTVLYCSSFSKTLGPGLRVGYVAPGRFLTDIWHRKVATSVTTSSTPQRALARYLDRGGYDLHLRRLRRTLAGNLDRLRAACAEHLPEGTRITRPDGGLLLWAELPPGADAVAIYRAARAEGITTAPGPAFSASGAYLTSLRLSGGHPWTPAIERGVERLGAIAREQMRDAPLDPGAFAIPTAQAA